MQCPQNCQEGHSRITEGTCLGCLPGYKGKLCTKRTTLIPIHVLRIYKCNKITYFHFLIALYSNYQICNVPPLPLEIKSGTTEQGKNDFKQLSIRQVAKSVVLNEVSIMNDGLLNELC